MDIRGFFSKPATKSCSSSSSNVTKEKREAPATALPPAKVLKATHTPTAVKILSPDSVVLNSNKKRATADLFKDNEDAIKTKLVKKQKAAEPSSKISSQKATKVKMPIEKIDLQRHPLHGKTFVFTGEFHEYSDRVQMAGEVERLGGKVVSAVSGKTTHLVYGHVLMNGLEPEKGSKYIKVKELTEQGKDIQLMDEEAFKALILAGSVSRTEKLSEVPKSLVPHVSSAINCELWADKYKPKEVKDLVGNASAIASLTNWLKSWESVHLHGGPKPMFNKSNPGAKAALLSGPPGIGKTSAAGIVARSLGFDVFELNASDARSKKAIGALLGDAVNSTSLSRSSKKRLVIMDEVDGMSGDDRGGSAELIKIIKTSKVPIICICNDRMKSQVRTLANHCYDLKFSKPMVDSIVKRICEVARMESMTVENSAVRILVQETQQDVRQVLGSLQMWQRTSNTMNFENIQDRKGQIRKDELFFLNFFDASRFIFNESKKPDTFHLRNDFYFVDYDLIPLIIHEKYPSVISSSRKGDFESVQALSAASDAVCDADLAQNYVRAKMEWGLLPTDAALNVRVASLADGSVGFPGFPEWLGKNSARGKKARLLSETAMHMRQTATVNPRTLRLDYISTLRTKLLKPLLENKKENISNTVDLMGSYGLDRDDLFETMQELQISSTGIDAFKGINSQMKSAFTREFNKTAHLSQALAFENGVAGLKPAKKKKIKSDDDDDDENDEEENDEEEMKKLIAVGSKTKKSAAPKKSSAPKKPKGKAKAVKK